MSLDKGLRVPQKQRKRRRLGTSAEGCVQRRAEHINHVWSYDFVWDQTDDGGMLKMMPIVDEFSRECLTIEVARSITADDVVETLERLFVKHGPPIFIRSDNGPEFIAESVRKFLRERGTGTLFIEPGSPWENPYIESFNSRFRDELLDRELFLGVIEARVLVEDFRREYNEERPHSSLDYQTPKQFAAACRNKTTKTAMTRSTEVTEESEAQNRPVSNAMESGRPQEYPRIGSSWTLITGGTKNGGSSGLHSQNTRHPIDDQWSGVFHRICAQAIALSRGRYGVSHGDLFWRSDPDALAVHQGSENLRAALIWLSSRRDLRSLITLLLARVLDLYDESDLLQEITRFLLEVRVLELFLGK
jgi:hypothetical protein